jgi:hypothetical protein
MNTDYTISVLQKEIDKLLKLKSGFVESKGTTKEYMEAIDTIDKKLIELKNTISFIKEYR